MVKMKIPGLRKSRTSPPSVTQKSPSKDSSSPKTQSISSVMESNATSITVQSSDSSTSLNVTRRSSPERMCPSRPKSEIYSSRTPVYGSSGSTVGSLAFPVSPFAPRLLSVQENQWVHQSVLLVFGQVGLPERPCDGTVTVHHHLDGYPATQWPVSAGYFKALVHLDPGTNRLRFEFTTKKISPISSNLTVNYLPLTACPPLQLVVVLAKDSTGEYECSSERKQREGDSIDMAVRKFRMAAYLTQAFTGEQMYRTRLGRRCFRLEEEWTLDSLSSNDRNAMRNVAKVHIIRAEKTVNDIRQLEADHRGDELYEIISETINARFQNLNPAVKRHFAVLVLDAKGDLKMEGLANHSAFASGIGIYGSQYLHTLPSYIEEVIPAFSDCTRVGSTNSRGGEGSDTPSFWEVATTTLASMMEAFISPQPPTQPREFEHVNRSFVTKEAYSFKTKSPGLRLCLPKEESGWPRIDCLKFRYHPCFRLPSDPIISALPDKPQVYVVDNGIVAGSQSGIVLTEIYLNDVYRSFLEFTVKPEREVLLTEEELRGKVPEAFRSETLKLKIYSAGQGQTTIEDFSALIKSSKVQLPNGYGIAYKSSSSGLSETSGSEKQEIILHTVTPGRMLTNIRVFHGSALDGLEFMYEDSSSQLFGRRGCEEDKEKVDVSDFTLDARKGEILLGFCVRSSCYIDGIEILTNLGRRSPLFGNPQGSSRSHTLIPPRGRSIAGVSGSCAQFVDDFSILYK